MTEVPAEIFREYDIRGLVGEQLSPALAHSLGRAVGTFVRRGVDRERTPVIVVGRDHRPSGTALAARLGDGLAACGCSVVDIGVTPTPVGYWAIQKLAADGGVQITGSHNPAEYNGFKITLLGRALHGDDIQSLRQTIEREDYESGVGGVENRPVLDDYIDDLAQNLAPAARPMKVVVDAGNGTAGLTAVPLYRRLGYDVVPLFCEPDGSFPNHHPDPTVVENLQDLCAEVAAQGADLGLAYDGDSDRLGVIDRDGQVIFGDRLMILLARQVLRAVPGAPIIGEVKCSKTLYDDIAAHGGEPVMWRTGHSLIKSKMKEIGAPLAGEMSGHIFFGHRYYGFDDAVYAGGRLLEVLGQSQASIGELLADVPTMVATPELRVECPEAHKFALVAAVRDRFRQRAAEIGAARIIDIDGVRVEWPDGWGLLRPSNTQPILVLRFEAKTEARLAAIRKIVEQELARAQAELRS